MINVDLCVIEQQEHHIVFAVRVPRQTVETNQAFFALLAGQHPLPAPKRPPRLLPLARLVRGRIVAAVAAVAAIAVVFGWDLAADAEQPPYEFASQVMLSHYDVDADRLVLTRWVRRNRPCTTTIERAVREAGGTTVWTARLFAPSLHVTKTFQHHTITVQLPDLKPGDYHYQSYLHADCGGKLQQHAATNPVPFTVP